MREDFDNYSNNYGKQKNNNTALYVIISVLSCIIIVGVVFAALMLTGVINIGKNEDDIQTVMVQESSAPAEKNEFTPIPVQQTMYVDCNVYLTLRTGPSVDYSEIHRIPTGDPLFVIEYSNDEFARVTHGGAEGYVSRKYLSSKQPYVWRYDEASVEDFVAGSVYGYVDAINTGDTSYVYNYYSGGLVQSELSSIANNSKVAAREELLSINCHSVKRLTKTSVSVVRDSNIRVYYYDGSVKDVVEKYSYTVEEIADRMYITSLKAM